jgi:hypothetical protein
MTNDQLAAKHTAFESLDALLNAPGGYFPSLNVAIPEIKTLADQYDYIQGSLGDPRRAARYSIRPRRIEPLTEDEKIEKRDGWEEGDPE